MQAARIFLLNASLVAVGVLVLYALVQSLVQSKLRAKRRFARRKAFLAHDSHEAHSISFLRF
jgi:uncharacterized membrane-anchored protein